MGRVAIPENPALNVIVEPFNDLLMAVLEQAQVICLVIIRQQLLNAYPFAHLILLLAAGLGDGVKRHTVPVVKAIAWNIGNYFF